MYLHVHSVLPWETQKAKNCFFQDLLKKKLLKQFDLTGRLKLVHNNSSSSENSSLLTLPEATHR